MNEHGSTNGGWVVTESAALELDYALAVVGSGYPLAPLSPAAAALVGAVADDWRAQWGDFLGQPGGAVGLLEHAAMLAGVLAEGNYDRATLAMRTLTVERALVSAKEQAAALGLTADAALPEAARLTDLAFRLLVTVYRSAGLELTSDSELGRRVAGELARLPDILAGGDKHDQFWHWLDRFYYESYRPWRAERAEAVRQLTQHAILALGGREKGGVPPDTAWLTSHNPVLRHPELRAAAQAGQLKVLFWAEPFGLADSMALLPGLVAVSFAEPGALYEHFEQVAADLARRVSALSDPTRLIMLRLIRNFGMVNTELAAYLQLARPTVSIHAKLLREAGLIRSRQEGRLVRHEIVPSEMCRLLRDLARFLDLSPETE